MKYLLYFLAFHLMLMVSFDIEMEYCTFLEKRITKRFHTNLMNKSWSEQGKKKT